MQLYVDGELTVRTAGSFCVAADGALRRGRAIVIVADDVKVVDAVGMAALSQATRRAAAAGVSCAVVPSPVLHAALLDGGLLDEVRVMSAEGRAADSETVPVAPLPSSDLGALVTTPKLTLRLPTWEDLHHFERWAADPMLDQMVGSPLLYRCRHVGAYDADFAARVTADPTSITALVVPAAGAPVGFVRLYNINLTEGFAFLETAVADAGALRRGWGVTASRLLVAYGMDALHLRRVEAKVYAYNVLSINALRRNGFVPEGSLRAAHRYDGRRWDLLVFGILHDEMVAQRRRGGIPRMALWPAPATAPA